MKESDGDAEEEDEDETLSGRKVNSTCDSVVKKSVVFGLLHQAVNVLPWQCVQRRFSSSVQS